MSSRVLQHSTQQPTQHCGNMNATLHTRQRRQQHKYRGHRRRLWRGAARSRASTTWTRLAGLVGSVPTLESKNVHLDCADRITACTPRPHSEDILQDCTPRSDSKDILQDRTPRIYSKTTLQRYIPRLHSKDILQECTKACTTRQYC